MSELFNTNRLQLPFTEKVRHDFSCYVYLGLNWGNFPQERILNLIIAQEGYEAHKIIQYGIYWTHLYIRFQDGLSALKSVAAFREMERMFSVEIVKNLLVALHSIELKKALRRSDLHLDYQPTVAQIDALDKEQSLGTPINRRILQTILREFGNSAIEYSMENHVTVTILKFMTMAEAVGASIAFGLWSKGYETFPNPFYYKISIFMEKKEANLIQSICIARGIPPATIKLDYFLSPNTVHQAWRCICGIPYPRSLEDAFARRDSSFVFQEQAQDASLGNRLNSAECSLEHPFMNRLGHECGFSSAVSYTPDFPASDISSLELAHQYAYFSRNIPLLSKELSPTTKISREVTVNMGPAHFGHPSLPQNQLRPKKFHFRQYAPKTVLPSISSFPPRMVKDNLYNKSVHNRGLRRNFDRKNRGTRKEKFST